MSSSRFLDNPGIQRYPRNEQQWRHWINEVARWIADQENVETINTNVTTAQNTANTAQTTAEEAKNASTSFRGEPGFTTWTTDGSGVYPAGDPTADLVANFYDSTGTEVASRTVEFTLTSAAGTISATDASKATSGLTTTVATVNDSSTSVRVDVTLELADGSKISGSLSANAIDTTTASTTPATGASK